MKKTKLLIVAGILTSLVLIACSKSSEPASPSAASGGNDNFPNGPITLMFAQTAGGATEAGCRIWQPYVEKELGVPLNFEFYNGANQQVGLTVLSKAENDGYFLGVSDPIGISVTMLLQDPEYTMDSFENICIYQTDPGIIMARKDAPYNTLEELIAYVKTQPPQSVTVGVASINVNVVGLNQLEAATGVKFNIVPFQGGGRARTALVGGQIPLGAFMYFGSSAVWEDTKILGVNVDSTNIEALKNVQTYNQVAGKKLDDISAINNVFAPAGFKEAYPDRYQFIVDAFARAFASPELAAKLSELDQDNWLTPIMGEENCRPINDAKFEFAQANIDYLAGN